MADDKVQQSRQRYMHASKKLKPWTSSRRNTASELIISSRVFFSYISHRMLVLCWVYYFYASFMHFEPKFLNLFSKQFTHLPLHAMQYSASLKQTSLCTVSSLSRLHSTFRKV